MTDEPKNERTQAEVEHIYAVYREYQRFLGWTQDSLGHEIAFENSASSIEYRSIESHLLIFEKYKPFVEKHFDHRNQFNLTQITNMLNQESSRRVLISLYPIFDVNPKLLELYSAQGGSYVEMDVVNGGVNKSNRKRLMFTEKPSEEVEAKREIERILIENQELYKKIAEKYKNIGEEQIVVCTLFDDAEVCVRFLNRDLKSGETKDGQIRTDNIRSCQILVRPNQHAKKGKASDFMLIELNITASGLVSSESVTAHVNQGFLFLSPPGGSQIDERTLMQLIASEKSDTEIQEELEGGATGIAEVLTK